MAYSRQEVKDHETVFNKKLYDNLQDGIDEVLERTNNMEDVLDSIIETQNIIINGDKTE